MKRYLKHVTIVIDDYDKAIKYYTEVLDFVLIEDTNQGHKRWVLICPDADGECSIVLGKATNDEQAMRIGDQTGGRVSFFIYTDDFYRDYNLYKERGVVFERPPLETSYGIVAVFKDIYGNLWDLVQSNF